jgi:hypothetical protein
MPTAITYLELNEVSLVDKGDDPNALVTLYKRKPDGENMTEEEIQALKDQVAKATASAEATKIENEKLRKFLLDEGYTIREDSVAKRAPEEMIEVEGEMVAKSAIPAPILKRLEQVEKAAEIARLEKRAKEELPNMRGTDLEKGRLLKAVDSVEGADTLLEILRAADALFGKMAGEAATEGKEGDMLTDEEKLDKMVQDYAAANKVTKTKAYAEVAKTPEGKKLIQASYKKGK